MPLFLQGIIPIEGRWWKESDYGEELPGYPERAVTEVICNAIVHRDRMEIGDEGEDVS